MTILDMDQLRLRLRDTWSAFQDSDSVKFLPILSRWIIVTARRMKNTLLIIGIVVMFYLLVDKRSLDTRDERTVTRLRQAAIDKHLEDSDWHVFDKISPSNMSDLESQFYYNDGTRRGQGKRKPKPQAKSQADSNVGDKNARKMGGNNLQVKIGDNAKDAGIAWCDVAALSINDTDTKTAFRSCKLPTISVSSSIERKINYLEKIDLPFLRNYRNPCWYEELPAVTEYNSKIHMFWWQVKDSFDRISKKMDARRKVGNNWRLRCLPLAYVIGLTHSGSLDLYRTLVGHPFIIKPATKEPFYWDRNRWKFPSNFSNYLDLFDEAAESIRSFSFPKKIGNSHVEFHPKVTIDGSVNYLFEFGGLRKVPGNEDYQSPLSLIPHLIKNLMRSFGTKVFLTLRNPVDRAFACYSSYEDVKQSKKSADEFHDIVESQITRLTDCFKKYPLRYCLHDSRITRSDKKVELHVGVYVGYVQEWLEVFPDMMVLRWEDIKDNRGAAYKKVVEHLGLYPDPKTIPSDKALESDVDPGFYMWKKTKILLTNFYEPFNKNLANLLKDLKFEYV